MSTRRKGNRTFVLVVLRRASLYHWQELPQVSFLSQQKFYRDKHVFCRTKSIFSRRDNHNFVATKVLSRQAYFCHDKQVSSNNFVATKVLSRQAYFCRDKRRVLCLSRQKLYLWQLPPMISLCTLHQTGLYLI